MVTVRTKRIVLIVLMVLFSAFVLGYWWYSQQYVSTEDAYVNAHVIPISAEVSGRVVKVFVENNQYVEAGKPLFNIEPARFNELVDQKKARVADAEAKLKVAELMAKRTDALVQQHVNTDQEGDIAAANVASATALLALAQSELEEAVLNLDHTEVFAPTNGWIGNMTLREGEGIAVGEPLFSLVSDAVFWVDAHFKETELEHLKVHQVAEITIDMYPDHVFKGSIESVSSATGSAFSLLPPENATGNWVKVTQRVPVRVRIEDLTPEHTLRIGSSAFVKVKITGFK